MIVIFQKFKTFWRTFWESMVKAYNKTFRDIVETSVQEWRDIEKINFLNIFVGKLNNLVNSEATFEVESDSGQTERLKFLGKDLENKRSQITENMLADGDYYIFPAHNEKGEIIHSYLTQQQVRILGMSGENITEAEGIIDWLVDNNNRVFYLLRHHKLDGNGTLTISYSSINEQGKKTAIKQWEYINEQAYSFANANHIGFGRYKSPASSRGLSPVYGVPLNFGCADIEARIFEDLKLLQDEFRNGKSVIFTDPRNLLRDDEKKEYKIAENIIPIKERAGKNGPNIDIFNPTLRYNEHYSKLVGDLALYEKQVGTSKGILTDNETAEKATATAVKRANADTISLIDKIRTAIDEGNEMTLQADGVFLNVSPELWSYKSDWYDPFEDPLEQWKRLIEAKNNKAAETADLVRWLFPYLSSEEIEEKIERINFESQGDTNNAIDKLLGGA